MAKSAVKVMVRIRPFNKRELAGLDANDFPSSILQFEENKIRVLDPECVKQVDMFQFHETFWSIPEYQKQYGVNKPYADQAFVFDTVGRPAVETAIEARHCCLFAYGQTGTGKSYTMLGSPDDPGIAPRLVDLLFERLAELQAGGKAGGWKTEVEISFMEIYNEKVKDLLTLEAPSPSASPGSPSSPGSPTTAGRKRGKKGGEEDYADLRVRTSPEIGVFVEGLTRLGREQGVQDAQVVKRIMRRGMEHRATAETKMNATSSRSHAIFLICLRMENALSGKKRYAHINLVDLAGSERVTMSGVKGQALVEATRINLSLSTLRRVIDALVENAGKKKGQQKTLPPYRDSMLTYVLSESLGGNSETVMLATVSPAESNREDTLNTLRYANKAKKIENTVRVNEAQGNVALGAMQAEMQRLRQELQTHEQEESPNTALREQHDEQRKHVEETLADMEREKEEHARRLEEMKRSAELAAQLEEEAAALKAEGVDTGHEEERRRREEAEQKLRLQEEERCRKEEEKRLKEEQARLEQEARDQLALQAQATAKRKEQSETAAAQLRKQQFALAFNKAFAKDSAHDHMGAHQTRLEQARDECQRAELELQETQRQLQRLHTERGMHSVRAARTAEEERLQRKQQVEQAEQRRQQVSLLQAHLEHALREHGTTQAEHAALHQQLEAARRGHASAAQSEEAARQSTREALARHRETNRRLTAESTRRAAELERLQAALQQLRQQVKDLRAMGREVRSQTDELLDGAGALDVENARLEVQRDDARRALPGAVAQRDMVEARQAELRGILTAMERNHSDLKGVVAGRFFKPGCARWGEVGQRQSPTPFQEGEWRAGGYSAVNQSPRASAAEVQRSGSPKSPAAGGSTPPRRLRTSSPTRSRPLRELAARLSTA